ncbi:MAG: DUF6145 family protein [Lachnospiraceae bacterium]|nr:DUF6145 family protein [Lachnospiraceae bacterium]
MEENVVLCGANSYTQKFYLNQKFYNLPELVQDELKALCVLFVEDVGGIFTMEFDPDGSLQLKVTSDPGDYLFDEIGSVLKVKQMQEQKLELLESLEMYYRMMFLNGADDGEDA